jgi:hypothetical protein
MATPNAGQHRTLWAGRPRLGRPGQSAIHQQHVSGGWLCVVGPLGVITGGGKSLTSVSQGGGQAEYLADWQGCGWDDAEGGSSQAARRGPDLDGELTMEAETVLKQEKEG